MVFEIVCSYCGKYIGTKEGADNGVAESLDKLGLPYVSHSICSDCYREQMTIINAMYNGGDEDV